MEPLTIYFDGLCEPKNPGGIATYGFVIKNADQVGIAAGRGVVAEGPTATNNFAEWAALGKALRWLVDNREFRPCSYIHIRGDSQLVINQLLGKYKCKAPHLQKLRARCWDLIEQLGLLTSTDAQWIPREQNTDADNLSRQAYIDRTGKEPPERTKKAK